MTDLDGTANKSRLGANVTVGVSMALARALAASAGKALWRWLAPDGVPPSLLTPQFNMPTAACTPLTRLRCSRYRPSAPSRLCREQARTRKGVSS